MKNMVGSYYNTAINLDIDNLYLLRFYEPIWFVRPFKWICGQAFLINLPSEKYMYSVYKCLLFTKSM